MEQSDLWQMLQQSGQMTYGWWYNGAVLPIAVLSACTYILVLYALTRKNEAPLTLLRWLFPASLPFVCVLPSYYASIALIKALLWVSAKPPATVQELSIDTLRQIGSYLDSLATIGLLGATLAAILAAASLLRLRYGPIGRQTLQSFSQLITEVVTTTIGPRPPGPSAQSKYGRITVKCGERQGNTFGVTDGALIGKHEATMTITDAIVSRRHARFEIQNGEPLLVDEQSRNGTYILRPDGRRIPVSTTPISLQHQDRIFLGAPDEPKAVELLFEKA